MSVAARPIEQEVWSKGRFLAWAATRMDDVRHEFNGFRQVAMSTATLGHNDIGRNIREKLRGRLPMGMECTPYGLRQMIATVSSALRGPDAFIACSAQCPGAVAISAPVIVLEVLSSVSGEESPRTSFRQPFVPAYAKRTTPCATLCQTRCQLMPNGPTGNQWVG